MISKLRESLTSKLGDLPVIWLVVFVAVLTLGPLCLLTYMCVTLASDAVTHEVEARVRATADVTASLMSAKLQSLAELVDSYADRPTLIAAVTQGNQKGGSDIRSHLQNLRLREGIATAFVADPKGVLVDIVPETPSIVGDDFSYRDWYRGVVSRDGAYVSEVYRTAAEGNPLVIAAASRVEVQRPGKEPRLVGILVAAYDLRAIQGYTDDLARGDNVSLTVTDQRGTVVAASGSEASELVSLADNPGIAAALKGRAGVLEAANEQEGGLLLAYAPVPRVGFAVTADVPRRTALEGVGALRSTVFGIAAVLALILIGALAVLALALRGRRMILEEMNRFQRDLKDARDEAFEASRLKSEFLASMSHEIRTPMNGVLGMTGMLLDTELSRDQREYAETVRISAEGLLTIINDILDFSKIEAGRLEFEVIDFDVRKVVEEVGDLLAEQAHAKGLELAIVMQSDVPTFVQGDPGRLRQVLTNLVGNAIKFTESGEVVVRTEVVEQDPAQVVIRFEVLDTGIGMDKAVLHKLFDAFSQADASTTRTHGGTGLGLAIASQLVERMGGEITVETELGRGSRFAFTISLPKQHDQVRPSRANRQHLEGVRVLIVDDNHTNRAILEHQVRSWGMYSVTAVDGVEALQKLRASAEKSSAFDMAIVDMEMPAMNGIELARAIRADSTLDATPLVLLTSSGLRGSAGAAKEAGFAVYLTKPVRQSQLYDAIAMVMGDGLESDRLITRHTLSEARSKNTPRLLIAEDNAVNQKVTAAMLAKLGYRSDVVANGAEAVDALERVPYGAVIMDCQMPVMDGFEATARIRAREGSEAHIPIIAVTASAMEGERERCLAAGMDDYVSKPVALGDLAVVLKRWVTATAESTEVGYSMDPQGHTGESPILDAGIVAQLRDLGREGEPDAFIQLAELFLGEADARLQALRNAVGNDDRDELGRQIHGLKGVAGTVGAARLAELCGAMERVLISESNEIDGAELRALIHEFGLVQEALAEAVPPPK